MQTLRGIKPFNDHFWAEDDDWWWLNHEYHNWPSRFSFAYIALADGRFIAGGCVGVWEINQNRNCYDYPVVYPTREAAIRADCARMIRLMRASRNWKSSFDSLKGEQLGTAINWALQTCAKACQEPSPKKVWVKPVSPPVVTEPVKPQLDLL